MAGVIEKGQRLHYGSTILRILRISDTGVLTLENVETGSWEEKSSVDVLDAWRQGQMTFDDPDQIDADNRRRAYRESSSFTLKPEERLLTQQRLVFVRATQSLPRTRSVLAMAIQEAWETSPNWKHVEKPKSAPSVNTVIGWVSRYEEAECDIRSLLARNASKGNHETRYTQVVLDIMDDMIDTCFMVEERPNLSNVCDLVNARISKKNVGLLLSEQIPPVSPRALSRRIKQRYSAYQIHSARYGARSAKIKFRTAGAGAEASRPLERVSMDHSRLDLFVIDGATGLLLGRPWLTVLLDEYTRLVVGFYLSFEEPSAVSVCMAMAHAIMPKCFDHIDPKLRPKQAWDAWGVFETLVVDNGMEFHGQAIEDSAARLGITIQYCPRKSPWYKGKIERFFGTLGEDLLDMIPGKSFSSILLKDEYDPDKHAVLSLEAANVVVNQWLVDVYHHSFHRGLLSSPAKRWDESIESAGRYLPSAAKNIQMAMGRKDTRVLSHKGIEFDSLVYNADILSTIRHLHGDRVKVDITVNDADLGSIIVLAPGGTATYEVPAIDLRYAQGMSRWQHKVCRRYQQIKWKESGDLMALLDAKERIIALIRQEMGGRKAKGPVKSAARFTNGSPGRASTAPAPMETAAPSSGEHQICADSTDKSKFKDRIPPISPCAAEVPAFAARVRR
ncbi:DDE-type integrase/transposase/recombinase [Pseudoxanthomonas mexicana]|uniref:DDE-type integrase/transposase/recombinase n=1 Tax=Pseudoxanthomonas mexicana TaxID=128785 RepID=UPI0022F37E78|nr:DDE-type integrase/transposase/recombinase [Pseudoxanthomonas mexicana]WBX94963.1 DDE-type integrase/transposase/recombinase [Pseudoxanthomonas mexicana]